MVTDLTKFCDQIDDPLEVSLERSNHLVTVNPTAHLPQPSSKAKTIQDLALLLSVSDVQQALGLGRNSTYALIRSGQLKSIRVGRLIKIPRVALEEYLQSY